MHNLPIKPLSVNECWQGQRFKTSKYRKYETDLLFILPKITLPAPPYQIEITFGLSSSLADFDNPVKPFIDVLQKKYLFNDRDIYKAVISKELVKKGAEYVEFSITPLTNERIRKVNQ